MSVAESEWFDVKGGGGRGCKEERESSSHNVPFTKLRYAGIKENCKTESHKRRSKMISNTIIAIAFEQ